MMIIKSGAHRQLPAYDAKQLELLLINEYPTTAINSMYYSYPLNDNRLMIEYDITFFNNDEQTYFFRKAYKRNGQWQLSKDFKTVNCIKGVYSLDEDEVTEMINTCMES
jgi:hypothetical protein